MHLQVIIIFLNGALNPGTGSLNIEFEPGIYDIVITAGDYSYLF